MRLLAIETSCDETAICLIEASGTFGTDFAYTILGDALLSQIAVHAPYGGVYPSLAKREHELNLIPILTECLTRAGALVESQTSLWKSDFHKTLEREPALATQLQTFLETYGVPDIDALAVTAGPGLEPALWVGVNFAQALAQAWNLPIVAVNHMEGHVVIAAASETGLAPVTFPALSLLVSGGHTELVLMREWGHYEILGSTRDDAAGEAFDKTARLMGLLYPGGPQISKLAAEARSENLPHVVTLPRPMIHDKSYSFSFSGLKTAVRRELTALTPLDEVGKKAFAREIENAIVEVLVSKTMRAVENLDVRTVIVGGGVSANIYLRDAMHAALRPLLGENAILFPAPVFATDNARMIALAGYFHALRGEYTDPLMLRARGGLTISDSGSAHQ